LSFLDNLRIRRTRGGKVASMDREATSDDLDALREFARTRQGVEFFVEPETMVTDTTAVAIAVDGEWTRRRVGSPKGIRQVAKPLGLESSEPNGAVCEGGRHYVFEREAALGQVLGDQPGDQVAEMAQTRPP